MTTRAVRSDHVELDALRVTHARYAPFASAPHSHSRTVCTVLLEGTWEEVVGGRAHHCAHGTMLAKPAGETHVDRIIGGARLVLIEVAPDAGSRLGASDRLLGRPSCVRGAALLGLAWRIAAELDAPDPFTATIVEGLALELIGSAGRESAAGPAHRAPPWLDRARELIRSTFHTAPQIQEIARAVDVHPVLLARAFRSHLGTSPGGYMRRIRLDWAARELVAGTRPLADVAHQAGFADQSHFTRAFRRHTGLTPGQYRGAFARGRATPPG